MNDKTDNKWQSISDKAILENIGNFIRHNRLNQNVSQDHVALEAGISRSTLSLLERGEKVRIDSLIRVLRVLNLLHVLELFEVQDQISPIAYAKLKKKERKQASPQKPDENKAEDLGW